MALFQEQPNLTLALSASLIILGLATLFYELMRWQRREQSNLLKISSQLRFLWLMMGFYILALVYSRNYLLLFLAFTSFLALKEYFSITPTRRADRRILFFAYLSVPLQFTFIWHEWLEAFLVFLPIYVFAILPMLMVIVGETKGYLRAFSTLSWGVFTTVYSLGHFAYLLVLPPEANPVAGGLGFFLYVVILTQMNHVSQYLFGSLFNYPALSLKVSQTRNWASLIGSTGVTALLALGTAPFLTPLKTSQALISGVLIAVGGFIGYVVMSAIKNDLRLRDRGSMTPGHGGVLNRIDMLMYNAPIFFYTVLYLFA